MSRRRQGTAHLTHRFAERWRGIGLSLVVVVATIWLGVTGKLGLYIHPRYFLFTTVMAALGLLFVLAGFVFRASPADDGAETRDGRAGHTAGWRALSLGGSALMLAVAAIATLALPPATLTSATATQREVNSGGLESDAATSQAATLVGTGDYGRLGVKEWVSLLAQSGDPALYADKTARVTGFVLPDTTDPDNVFYVARFVVTCCAVDAQPIGVAVYQPGWQASHDADDWVQVTGTFVSNPSGKSAVNLAILPTDIESVDQPSDPYVY